jgi:hypothetical protein
LIQRRILVVNALIIKAVAIFAKKKAEQGAGQTNEECAESTGSYEQGYRYCEVNVDKS